VFVDGLDFVFNFHFAHRVAIEIETLGVVNEPVQYGGGEGGFGNPQSSLKFFNKFGQVFLVAEQPFFDAAQVLAHCLGGAPRVVRGDGLDDDAVLFYKNGPPVGFGGLMANVALILTAPCLVYHFHKIRQDPVSRRQCDCPVERGVPT